MPFAGQNQKENVYVLTKSRQHQLNSIDKLHTKKPCQTSSVDLIRTAFGYSFEESLVKQNQSPEGAR